MRMVHQNIQKSPSLFTTALSTLFLHSSHSPRLITKWHLDVLLAATRSVAHAVQQTIDYALLALVQMGASIPATSSVLELLESDPPPTAWVLHAELGAKRAPLRTAEEWVAGSRSSSEGGVVARVTRAAHEEESLNGVLLLDSLLRWSRVNTLVSHIRLRGCPRRGCGGGV